MSCAGTAAAAALRAGIRSPRNRWRAALGQPASAPRGMWRRVMLSRRINKHQWHGWDKRRLRRQQRIKRVSIGHQKKSNNWLNVGAGAPLRRHQHHTYRVCLTYSYGCCACALHYLLALCDTADARTLHAHSVRAVPQIFAPFCVRWFNARAGAISALRSRSSDRRDSSWPPRAGCATTAACRCASSCTASFSLALCVLPYAVCAYF